MIAIGIECTPKHRSTVCMAESKRIALNTISGNSFDRNTVLSRTSDSIGVESGTYRTVPQFTTSSRGRSRDGRDGRWSLVRVDNRIIDG
eukprot:scaffold156884_cov16-Prasinocladus_malaysianus.AAC.1